MSFIQPPVANLRTQLQRVNVIRPPWITAVTLNRNASEMPEVLRLEWEDKRPMSDVTGFPKKFSPAVRGGAIDSL